jgi:UDP-N-acetylglucosamine acyltransferase
MSIHPTAIIDPLAVISSNVEIGPYVIVEKGVVIRDDVIIGPHAIIHKGTTLDNHVKIGAHAIVGGRPQVYHFDESVISFTHVAENVRVGEGVTIHRPAIPEGVTRVGRDSFLMAYAHVGHDCNVGERVTLTNNVLLGGGVEVGDDTNIGGGAAIHQKIRIGSGVMVGGLAIMTLDVPPYVTVANRNSLYGLNVVGLKRRGVSQSVIGDLKRCYQFVFGDKGNPVLKAQQSLDLLIPKTDEGELFIKFFIEKSNRCFVQPEGL